MSDLVALMENPGTALWVLDALQRDLTRQLERKTNGLGLPPHMNEVLAALQEVAEVNLRDLGSAIGTMSGNVGPGSAAMVSVSEAAGLVGKSESYIRRLVRDRRIRCQRVGQRTWLVDLDSLESVLGRTAA